MVEIRWTQEAEHWLIDIYHYISEDKPVAAKKVVSEIYEKVQILTQFPKIGYIYNGGLFGNIRILMYGHYRIAYLIKKESIDILGVFHGAMKIDKYMKR